MDRDSIVSAVNEVFQDAFEMDESELSPEKHLFDDLGLDSLDVVDLVVALQQKFDVRIKEDQRVREIRTLGELYDYILLVKEERGLE